MKFYIAIPVYKAEAFLSECVSSVLSQTCQDFEIVLVDDGSPDGSGRLCDEFAARDGRIHAIHQKNTGPYGARRTAIHFILDHGSPEDRAVFLDADDSLKPEALETLARCIRETGADPGIPWGRQVYEGEVLRPFPRDMAYIGTGTDRRRCIRSSFRTAGTILCGKRSRPCPCCPGRTTRNSTPSASVRTCCKASPCTGTAGRRCSCRTACTTTPRIPTPPPTAWGMKNTG